MTSMTIVWRRMGEEYKKECLAPAFKDARRCIMIYGAFHTSGKSELRIISGRMNAVAYRDILREITIPFIDKAGSRSEIILMKDNDPKHKARIVQQYLQEENIQCLDWPPSSPDLNPIEHLWDLLKRKLPGKDIKSIEHLKTVTISAWNEIQPDELKKLVASMKNRFQEVIRYKGNPTSY